jgi:DNA-binding beta-propeller fold protein YncE
MTLRPFIPLMALLGLLLAAAPAPAVYTYAGQFGSLGTGNGQFGRGILGAGSERQWDDPAGIAVQPNGNLVVVDVSNNRVQRFSADGRFLGKFGFRGHDQGFVRIRMVRQMFQPEGVATDRAGNIYLADSGNDRIMKYTPTGRWLRRLLRTGSFPSQAVQPWGVAVGGTTVFTTDQGNYEVDKMGVNGGWRGAFGSFGRTPGQFVTPYGIAATPSGNLVYVTDLIRHKILIFNGSSGLFLAEFGRAGDGPGEFLKPAGITIGADGTLFVADRCNWRIQRFTADGRFLESFGEGRLASPTFLAQNPNGDIYVSDYHRVVRFSPRAGLRRASAPPARAAHHNDIDVVCRRVAEMNGVPQRRAPQR